MTKRTIILAHPQARANAVQAVKDAPDGFSVVISDLTRNSVQNAAMWPILEAFSQQLEWPVNGRMVTMAPEEWKDVLSAAFRRETARLALGLDGGVVMLGLRTSKMGKREFSDWLTFLHAIAIDRDVVVYAEACA